MKFVEAFCHFFNLLEKNMKLSINFYQPKVDIYNLWQNQGYVFLKNL
jgi:hypothetical protein